MNGEGGTHAAPHSQRAIVAATGDFHLRVDSIDATNDELIRASSDADLLILCGDMTDNGRILEADALVALVADLGIPICAVLGNHDRRTLRRREFRRVLESGGVHLLDRDASVFTISNGLRVGVAGVGGYGGGFWPDEAPGLISTRFSQAVAVRARREAARLDEVLTSLAVQTPDVTIVSLHYAPTTTTLGEEPPAKHWMLGNSILGRVIDQHTVTLVVHGHAHLGNYLGSTPGGTPVRNVALPVIGRTAILDVFADGTVRDAAPTPTGRVALRSAVSSQ